MVPFTIFILSALRAVTEVALLSLLGQGIVGLLAGEGRRQNAVYRLFCVVTGPPLRLLRLLLPKAVSNRLLSLMAVGLLFLLWAFLGYAKHSLCRGIPGAC